MAGVVDIFRSYSVLARLVCANSLVFVLMMIFAIIEKSGGALPFSPILNLALAAPVQVWVHYPWTIITYMFTHENFFHILFNMLWLLWFGRMFLEVGSTKTLMWLYLGGGLGGGLLYMLLYPLLPGFYGAMPLLLGASASVMAIMAATAVLIPDYTLHLFFLGDVKLKWMAVAMILLAFLGLGGGNAAGGIAHVGGVLTGVIAGLNMKHRPAKVHSVHRKNPFKNIDKSQIADIRQRPAAHNAAELEMADARRLDALLDKIHLSGFKSLTKAERAELEELSKRVSK
ncbi:MAG: rhomboid family intramembrane serine protease [Prevotella sp.]|nr:rhomboid family intramembrane serine protease [Prevotella sp.]MCM1074228.1 rhomboid family intramembrane serine protease [Ruminococcus sp.]